MASHIVLLSASLLTWILFLILNSADAAVFQGACTKSSECTSSLGDGGICTNKQCLCQSGFIYSLTTTKCMYKVGILGDVCQNDTQICYLATDSTQKMGCVQGTCQCLSPFVLSLDKTKCVLSKKVGDTCSLSSECTAALGDGGLCTNNICRCQDGFTYLKNVCAYRVVNAGDKCTDQYQTCDVDADGKQLSCIDGKCQRSTAAATTLSLTVLITAIIWSFVK